MAVLRAVRTHSMACIRIARGLTLKRWRTHRSCDASQWDHDSIRAPQLFGSSMRRACPIIMREETGCCVPHDICGRTTWLQYEFRVQRTLCQQHESDEEDRRCNSEPAKAARWPAAVDQLVLDENLNQEAKFDEQLTTLRRILRASNNSLKAPLFSETGILPIRYRRAQLALWYLMNVLQTEPPIPRKALIGAQYLARENKTCYYNYCGVLQDGSRPLTGMTMTLHAVMHLYRLWRPGGSRMGPSFSLIRRFSHWVFGW